MSSKKQLKIGYVLRKFPKLSETFILNELLALEARGAYVHIFSLLPPREPRFHADLAKLKASITYVPGFDNLESLFKYNREAARMFPSAYRRVILHALLSGKPRYVWRTLQSGFIAVRAKRLRLQRLHAHFASRATSVSLSTSRITGLPYSFTAHAVDIFKDDVDRTLLEKKINLADRVIAISEFNKTFLDQNYASTESNVVRVYNGIDTNRFAPNGHRTGSPFTVLAVARFVPKKGLDVLIEACRHLRDRGLDFRCWIVGKGALRHALVNHIKTHCLGDRVSLLGSHTQTEIVGRYQKADLFALPCLTDARGNRDGLPVAIVEALACGLPVVATATTGIPEAVKHDHNGLIVPEKDPVSLADAIESLMRDKPRYERLKSRARSSITPQFDIRETSRTLYQLLAENTA